MEWRLLEEIPFSIDESGFLAEMCVKPGSPREASCQELIYRACALAKPRALYLPLRIENLEETGMTAGGRRFQSTLFKPWLREGEEIYFFLASCGPEIGSWSGDFYGDPLRRYWADRLAERALLLAVAALENALRPLIEDEYLAAMNPGSFPGWPLEEQRLIFALLGGAAAACGITLNEQYVMQPQKSFSGFYFGSAAAYCNCGLCRRSRCPNRRAAFVDDSC